MQGALLLADLPVENGRVTIRTFQPGDEAAFRSLNESWISKHFRMEPHDYETLDDPHTHILNPGGQILCVEEDGAVFGCVALVPAQEPQTYELAKMAVDETWQGRGMGRKLLTAAVRYAREVLKARALYLDSNKKLKNAVHLYEAVGFRHLPPERVQPTPYERADVHMELIF
ncbi:GNAT family N-acetyltransferase [Terriglobus tenax]|uniref:GNAT family N-acetyltransferase n=1 Tax=Terriglobus tenax TaxID=1111115 RepID=UPI0021E05704|nr:GNAT family N-acetyltransferase [Terriglobus tenax]